MTARADPSQCNHLATRWSEQALNSPCGVSGCNLPGVVPIAVNIDPRFPGIAGIDGKPAWRHELLACRRDAHRGFGIPLDYPIPEDGSPIELWPEPKWSDWGM
jgi:hypothetical protein